MPETGVDFRCAGPPHFGYSLRPANGRMSRSVPCLTSNRAGFEYQTKPTTIMAIMAELQELIAASVKNYREGSIIKGHVLEIRPREFLIDIGYKGEGVIPASEFEDPQDVEIGDEVEVLLERLENGEGMVVLSKEKAAARQNWGENRPGLQGRRSHQGPRQSRRQGRSHGQRRRGSFPSRLPDRHHSAEGSPAIR